jgi:predicted phage terminase large subunit-like protein
VSLTEFDLAARAWRAMPHTVGRRLSFGTFMAPMHVQLISWLLLLNANRIIPRVAISMPPGSGKSEIICYYDSIWLLEHNPARKIVLASYAGTLAEEQGKRVRNTIETMQDVCTVRIKDDSRAADRWRTTAGGGMWTTGIGGSLTGRRASNLKVDDPHKNFAEATSEKNQIDTWNWWTSTARTRLLPRSSMSVIQTRWAEGDVIGRLRAQDEQRGEWCFAVLPAIAETNETIETVIGKAWCDKLRARGVELFPWHRGVNEALWPELEPGVAWFDEEEYAAIRSEVGEVVWAGLYQQRPAPLEGGMFKRENWVKIDAMPAGPATVVRRWDLAATADTAADATASCLMALHHKTRMLYILDMTRHRLESQDVEELVHNTAVEDRDRWGRTLHIRIEREPGASGKGVESTYLRTVLEGFNVEFKPSSGSKEVRALPFSGQSGAKHVHLCKREVDGEFVVPNWWEWFIEESAAFPNAKHDDMVDVASLAYVDLIELMPRRRKAQVGSAARKQLGF